MASILAMAQLSSATPRQDRLLDFPDWWGPMLVKELRQGMRSAGFVWTFLAMQLALAGLASFSLLNEDTDGGYKFFWWAVCAVLCCALPLRGFSALHDELRLQTIDTLVLTRQSAWRIALGKWLSLIGQGLIFCSTVMPYAVVWYFLGGINPVQELERLWLVFSAGAVFTAVTLGLSWVRHYIVRGCFVIAVLLLAFYYCRVLMASLGNAAPAGGGMLDLLEFLEVWRLKTQALQLEKWTVVWVKGLLGLWTIYFFLDLGAGVLAPLSENRSTLRRVLGCAMVAVLLSAWLLVPEIRAVCLVSAVVVAVATGLQSMGEPQFGLQVQVHAFVRRGMPGRVAARWLCPGWAAGVVHWFLIGGAVVAGWCAWRLEILALDHTLPAETMKRILQGIALFGAGFTAFAIARVLAARRPHNGSLVTASAIILAGVHTLTSVAGPQREGTGRWAFFLTPTTGLSAWQWPQTENEYLILDAPAAKFGSPAPDQALTSIELQRWLASFEEPGVVRLDYAVDTILEKLKQKGYLVRVHRGIAPPDYTGVLAATLLSTTLWALIAALVSARGFRQVRAAEAASAESLRREKEDGPEKGLGD